MDVYKIIFQANDRTVSVWGKCMQSDLVSAKTTNNGRVTWAICGFWFMSLEPRHPGSSVFRRLHRITPSRSVLAKSSMVDSGQWTLWSALSAPHLVSQFAQSRQPPFAMSATTGETVKSKNPTFVLE